MNIQFGIIRRDFTSKGFTLIELLVVIAIIAVLTAIVIVFINPVGRTADSRDRTAAANVRSVGAAVTTCLTEEQRLGSGLAFGANGNATATPNFQIQDSASLTLGCGNFTWMSTTKTYSSASRPSGISVYNNDTSSTAPTKVCVWATGGTQSGTTNYWVYTTANPTVRSVTSNPATTNNCTTL